MNYHVLHIFNGKQQMRMFLNSKNQIYLEISESGKEDSANYICLAGDDAKMFEIELANLIVKMNEKL